MDKKKASLTEVWSAQIVPLHGGHTVRDIAGTFRCSNTAVHNAIDKFNVVWWQEKDWSSTEDCHQGGPLNKTDSNGLAEELLYKTFVLLYS